MAPVLVPKPHELSSEILPPPFPMTPAFDTPQLSPVLFARIEFVTWSAVLLARIAAPEPAMPALLFEKVLLVTVPAWSL